MSTEITSKIGTNSTFQFDSIDTFYIQNSNPINIIYDTKSIKYDSNGWHMYLVFIHPVFEQTFPLGLLEQPSFDLLLHTQIISPQI